MEYVEVTNSRNQHRNSHITHCFRNSIFVNLTKKWNFKNNLLEIMTYPYHKLDLFSFGNCTYLCTLY